MTAPTDATGIRTDHSRAHSDGAHSHGVGTGKPGASRADRLTSYRLADFATPTGREEEWRFTPMAPLAPLMSGELAADGVQVSADLVPGVRLETVPRTDPRLGLTPAPGDRAAAAAWESVRSAQVLTVSDQADAGTPVTVTIRGVNQTPSVAHLAVIAEPNSRGTVILDHSGLARLTQTVEFVLGEGAQLTVVSIQEWDRGAIHAGSHRARIGKDATFKHVAVTLGGDLVRLTPEATFAGPGAEVTLLGLYITDAGQHHEHRLYVDHDLPACTSRVAYKGALQGQGAHSVWVGDVLIRAEAEGTDSYELNRNLVLTDGARADSVPNLEIETGEIAGAGHASATGRFDDEQLFYLQARGIPQAIARRLVVHGFFAELVQQIGVPALQERLIAAIDAELDPGEPATGEPATSEPATSVGEQQ